MSYIKDQLTHTLKSFNVNLGNENYSGKVRENFYLDDKIVMVTTDRVSAFDHILGTIPSSTKTSVTASSTFSHVSYLFWSDQILFMSGV